VYAVIFRATIKQPDLDYERVSKRLRELAFQDYNCADFVTVIEGSDEITISYWHSLDDIKAWRKNPAHIEAIEHGKKNGFSHYQIEVVEIKRAYQSKTF